MNILVIDDDLNIRNMLKDILKDENHIVFSAEDGNKGLEIFNIEKIDLCFLDVWMPQIGGIDVLKKIKDNYPEVEVVMISGQAKLSQAVKATKIGAFDFIEKPLSLDEILTTIKTIEKLKKEGRKALEKSSIRLDIIIGESPQIKMINGIIENSAKSDARILITGENGTGKELIAREIHLKSSRRTKAFVGVNCAAIPENLIESELFGHVKGSFTGATSDRIGKFESANGGTLFLDEIADMSLATQSKVLRVLQDLKFTKIGSIESLDIDIRIISATNKDIKEEIKKGNFREDLYYRLNVIPFHVPALRERIIDIPLLINYFIQKISDVNKIKRKSISNEAIEYMKKYSWPGNIRQLRNIVERLIVMVPKDEITLQDIKKYLDEEFTFNPSADINQYDNYKLNAAREEFEKNFIEKKLKENNYNISKTAKNLGIYPSNLYSKMNKLGINLGKK